MSGKLTGTTVVGQSGRQYVRTDLLKSDLRKPDLLNVYITESGGESFVAKRVSKDTFTKLQHLRREFAGSKYLRLHVDENEDDLVVIYKKLRGNLFRFSKDFTGPSAIEPKMEITWAAGKGLEELHAKGYAFFDMKPDNILADWEDPASSDRHGWPVVSQTLLSDLDSVYDMKGQWLVRPKKEWRHFRLGNVRWRAPEMQTGQGIGQFSDVFAYGLVYLYAVIGETPLGDDEYEIIAKKRGTLEEVLGLSVTFEFFGPPPPELLKHIDDKEWQGLIENAAAEVKSSEEQARMAGLDPTKPFKEWSVEDYPHLLPYRKEIIAKMLELAPGERLSMQKVMEDPSWGKRR